MPSFTILGLDNPDGNITAEYPLKLDGLIGREILLVPNCCYTCRSSAHHIFLRFDATDLTNPDEEIT
jgi:hypothetical protein